MKIRLLTFFLATLMLAGCFVGCADPDAPDSESTTTQVTGDAVTTLPGDVVYVDENGYEIDDLPKELNYNNKKITALAWSDHTMHEFESTSEQQTADIVQDALLERNQTVEDRLGVELKYVYEKGNGDNMTSFIKAVDAGAVAGEYDYLATYSRIAPRLAVDGKLQDMNELDYMNFDKPWWPDSLVEESTLNDQLYYASGDISTNLIWMMQGMFFNKNLMKEYQIADDPYELVSEYKWTISVFMKMCENKHQDITGDGKSEDDIYGYSVYQVNLDDFAVGANFKPIVNVDGHLELSDDLDSDWISTLVDDFIDFVKADYVFNKDDTKTRNIFFEERSLFMNDRLFVIAGKDYSSNPTKIDFEYGIVPMPLRNEKQKQYCSNLGNPYTIYSVPITNDMERKQMAGAILECLASESYRQVTPKVYELAIKAKYSSGDDAAKMFDLIRSTVVFDAGRLFNIANYFAANIFRSEVVRGNNSWFTNVRKNRDKLEGDIAKINIAFGYTG